MKHVLIIEDELAIAETLTYACIEAGIATTHCLFGHEGIAATQKQAFDFVVLDVGLPDMTGFDVCKQIRASAKTSISSMPILFLTARNHEIDRIVCLEIGADDYVTKTFSPREVVARINGIFDGPAISKQATSRRRNQSFSTRRKCLPHSILGPVFRANALRIFVIKNLNSATKTRIFARYAHGYCMGAGRKHLRAHGGCAH